MIIWHETLFGCMIPYFLVNSLFNPVYLFPIAYDTILPLTGMVGGREETPSRDSDEDYQSSHPFW